MRQGGTSVGATSVQQQLAGSGGRFGWLGRASVEQQQTGRGERQLGAEEVGCTAGAPGIRSYIDYRAKGANDNLGSAVV